MGSEVRRSEMKTNGRHRLIIAAVFVLFAAGTAAAQAGRGTARMGGTVVDKDGKGIPNAKIEAVFGKDMASKMEAVTNEKGEWAILGVGTGSWVITASADGYLPASVNYASKQLDRNPKIKITLEKKNVGTGMVQDEKSFELLDQGNQFYQDGRYDTALLMYEQFLEKNPAAYQVKLNVGDCYREKGDYAKAMEYYNLVVAQADTDPAMGKNMKAKSLAAIGLCYLRQNNLDEAQKYFRQSIDTAPQDETLAYNVGEICFSNQQIDEATKYFELAVQIKPDWADPYLKLGYVYLNKADMTKAAEYLEKFIKLEPNTERTAQAQNILNTIKK
jgi:tetratricopeptide (TPR) repeat protein